MMTFDQLNELIDKRVVEILKNDISLRVDVGYGNDPYGGRSVEVTLLLNYEPVAWASDRLPED